MASSIISKEALGSPWATIDPFLICAHHEDDYPRGNANLGPDAAPLLRPQGGAALVSSWSMYFGDAVPGFPAHPHRGFETITIVRRGIVDHADSLGASARFGAGDVQWLTAGSGIVHAEMFPLLDAAGPNPLELFQIWLNLPARSKMVDPAFTMFWADDIPCSMTRDGDGTTELRYIVGAPADAGVAAPSPPPHSWAADPSSDVAIWTISMAPGARWTLPPAAGPATRRQLCFFKGDSMTIDGETVMHASAIEVRCEHAVEIVNGSAPCEIMMLQARPIMEPVAQAGPFVMNTPEELRQAYADYRRTRFGGWPWDSDAPVHGPGRRRFASVQAR